MTRDIEALARHNVDKAERQNSFGVVPRTGARRVLN
jgi:hypothetical protein